MPFLKKILKKFAKQTLTYWQKVDSDSYGKPAYADPVEIDCRWEDKLQEVLMSDGRKVMSKAYILIGTQLLPGSLVFLGMLTDWQELPTYPMVPTNLQGGREVLLCKTTPDLKAQEFLYEVYL